MTVAEDLEESGMTLIEVTIVVFLIVLLAFFGARSWGVKGEREHEARVRLLEIWTTEKRYYAFRRQYTADWNELGMTDIQTAAHGDYTFLVSVTNSGADFLATATPVKGGRVLQINRLGTVSYLSP